MRFAGSSAPALAVLVGHAVIARAPALIAEMYDERSVLVRPSSLIPVVSAPENMRDLAVESDAGAVGVEPGAAEAATSPPEAAVALAESFGADLADAFSPHPASAAALASANAANVKRYCINISVLFAWVWL